MDKIDDYKDLLLALIESAKNVFLSTIDEDGYPSTRAMLNLKNKELYPHLTELYEKEENPFTVFLSTNASSVKMNEIGANNKVCLYYCNEDNYIGITMRGTIEVIYDKEFNQSAWAEGWELYYPGGIESADFTMLRFIPENLKSYGDLSLSVKELK